MSRLQHHASIIMWDLNDEGDGVKHDDENWS